MRLTIVCLVIGFINIITMGSYKTSYETMSVPIEQADFLDLEELNQKLDSVNANLETLQHEKFTSNNHSTNIN